MSRPRFEHLAWSKARHGRWRPELADSAVAAPDPGLLGLPHQAGTPAPADAAALTALAERFELPVVPGRFFGERGGVRVAPGGKPARCAAALDTFQTAVRAFHEERAAAAEPA